MRKYAQPSDVRRPVVHPRDPLAPPKTDSTLTTGGSVAGEGLSLGEQAVARAQLAVVRHLLRQQQRRSSGSSR